ncbi:hypothetical protein NF867_11870 [Solitalea sp. MAHUQ-68]|uniref:Uncharacterized protein n=1 Tax=Solitalea agri TaxID=2953739 RepID=A0A9X2F2S4_9SPHI|nr:hypothetical protein [Solitalea agri]MCO4293562.1 hypothetical protein [Solitalea agri]
MNDLKFLDVVDINAIEASCTNGGGGPGMYPPGHWKYGVAFVSGCFENFWAGLSDALNGE